MGAGIEKKGALGQQLAASGKARRAEAISRKGAGLGGGKGRARAVIEDRMDQNDREGKQKQGKRGRPGRPIEGRPPMGPLPPWQKEGRPFEPPKETYDPPRGDRPPRPVPPRDDIARPLPYFPPRGDRPIRGNDQFGPDRPGVPVEAPTPARDDYFDRERFAAMGGDVKALAEVEAKGRPPKSDWHRRKKEEWNQRRKERGMPRDVRGGGTDFGPGRGSRIPKGPTRGRSFGNDQLPKSFRGGGFLQDFLSRISQLKGGGIR